jgi:hypothetical protein
MIRDFPFAFAALIVPPPKATIKRKFVHAVCRMARAGDELRADGSLTP